MSYKTLRVGSYVAWLAGLVVFIGVVAAQGFREVLSATAAAGWGLVWVSSITALPTFLDAVAWQRLIAPRAAVPLLRLVWFRWICESVNRLLPVANVGGDMLRAWLAKRGAGVPGAIAGASVVVDLTLGVLTQLVFTLLGLGVLLSVGAGNDLLRFAVIGGGLLALGLLGFLAAQKFGLFEFSSRLVHTVASRAGWASIVDDARSLDDEIRAMYVRRRALSASAVWRFLGWLAGTVEVWAALWVLGHPVGFGEALMLESLVQAVRSATFVVPGALGIQEGALVVLGAAIGLPADVSLALSLMKRIRELIQGIPGIVAWQLSELHRLWVSGRGRVTESAASVGHERGANLGD